MAQPTYLKADKGFGRLLFDLGDKKERVSLMLETQALGGFILDVTADVVIFQQEIDRHNTAIVYIPLSKIAGVKAFFKP